ncbi:hypothetical protein [uncultured Clostridium sp.]|uniref:hypothetical protein n=1 Tax=uncultured Clostridium sp. TaxID=59620 RepID=UPI0025EDE523|nr:hypothetical protein [uncultured Clostridium sp.]MDU4884661.1 hypothetical protein [Clostridium celatum]MDU7077840.1 hypothetical protein [Clostridium celatum]
MKYQQLMKEYYVDINNLNQLLKTMVDSYRLLIAGAAELNNIYEAKSSYVKDAVHRANKLGDTIDNLIDLLEACGETYFKYCAVMGEYILKKSDNKVILTEVDEELFFQDSSVREEFEMLKAYKKEQEEKLKN